MSAEPPKLREVADELRQASTFLAGMAAGIDYAANYSAGDTPPASEPSPPPRSEYRSQRQPTQRPILDLMRDLGEPITVSELMRTLRSHGLDPLRPTVIQVMQRLVRRGLAKQIGHRYQLIRADGDQTEVVSELSAFLPQGLPRPSGTNSEG
ncbi:hypothetical protein [Azospirillum soli]|uniref:hypothetical protein n=1 Tax=Azospirillum soli TaxID=1304799 RepID=UPI001AEB9A22|nr:hypothetical protein [Azospirillum soli]MBP2311495.1 hypothetical protein [Azospirillum soli]